MGKYSVEIINGKEYGVYTDDDGIPMILGDPQKDMAEAIAKANEESRRRNEPFGYEKYFQDSVNDTHISKEEREDLDTLMDTSRIDKIQNSPSQSIVDNMRENGDYDIDPRFGAPRYYEGTTIRTKEYDKYMDNIASKQQSDEQHRLKRNAFIQKALIITGCVVAGLLLIGYITYMTFKG